ncbi:MAG: adenine deaminase [Saprospiraceae bacterium]
MEVSGHIIDILNRKIFKGIITIVNDKIEKISETLDEVQDHYILPGFIDAHIHIESSMVTPYEFAKTALKHGTIATVSDPHEIANVCGMDGIDFMIKNANNTGLKFFFGAPSCVPATSFENAGYEIGVAQIEQLMKRDDIWYLSEMMNWPGVLYSDPIVMQKIQAAHKYKKPIDGHAPGLKGQDAKQYSKPGISTDHECYMLDEALDKISCGMSIIIREGSAAKNFDVLHPLIRLFPHQVMFCSDDKHPDDLITGHLNLLVKRALMLGYDIFDVLRIACINPVKHYNLPVGCLQEGALADFIFINNIEEWEVTHTYSNGKLVYHDGKVNIPFKKTDIINNFNCLPVVENALKVPYVIGDIPVIKAIDGSLITEKFLASPKSEDGFLVSDTDRDILKICVVNRYKNSPPAVGFIKNFNLKGCAIASTVAHDSHNIIAVGDDDSLIVKAINLLIASQGGLSAVTYDDFQHISLPVAGLMSDQSVEEIGHQYSKISEFVRSQGCRLTAPYMTLSFMALLVIPKIKISDLGMFDAEKFAFY